MPPKTNFDIEISLIFIRTLTIDGEDFVSYSGCLLRLTQKVEQTDAQNLKYHRIGKKTAKIKVEQINAQYLKYQRTCKKR